jgi:hypothetical protein
MKQPTQEQIKEFWEWCGIVRYIENGLEHWKLKDKNEFVSYYPLSTDLNNLFKYAVPKLEGIKLITNDAPSGDRFFNATTHYGRDKKTITNEDPALALYWAIWEVIHG